MLSLIVFLCGAAVMVLELVGSRLLAPWLGASLVVWTGLIGVVLACLALGAWLGGALADKRPHPRLLAAIILASGFCTLFTALSHGLVLELVARLSLYLAVVAGGLVLFGPASVLLGMVSPFAVRLALHDTRSAGRVAGRLYALSTLGSIAGTFLAGFVLLAHVGSERLLLGLAATLGLVAVLAAARSRVTWLALAVLLGFSWLALQWQDARDARMAAAGRHVLDTTYSRVEVYDGTHAATGRPVRVLSTGPGHFQSAMFLDDPAALLLPYTQFFTLAARLAPPHGRVLILGGGACIAPRAIKSTRPDLDVVVVELDPGVTAIALTHFGLQADAGVRVVHEDARAFLQRDASQWDVLLLDVFDAQYAVPFHLASRELARLAQSRLRPGGLVIMNTISARQGAGARLAASVARTFAEVFPVVELFAAHPDRAPHEVQNLMLVAGERPLHLSLQAMGQTVSQAMPLPSEDPHAAAVSAMLATPVLLQREDALLLTDDFAPTEHLAEVMRREQSRRP